MERGTRPQYSRSSSRYQKPWQEKCKDYIRNLIAFMFTNVGIIGLVVGYTTAGAFMFIAIEGEHSEVIYGSAQRFRNKTVEDLWDLTYKGNIFNPTAWRENVTKIILAYQEKFVLQAKKGIDVTSYQQWSFSGAFLYSLTVITTIGYGNLSPRTEWGKFATVIYAIAGMPLFLLYLSNIGDILARSFKWAYFKMCLCRGCPGSSTFKRRRVQKDMPMTKLQPSQDEFLAQPEWQISKAEEMQSYAKTNSHAMPHLENEESEEEDDEGEEEDEEEEDGDSSRSSRRDKYDPQSVTVPITICLLFMVWYVVVGALLFRVWEDWSLLDGSYFCFISLSTIGFGDIVPGDKIYNHSSENLSVSFIATAVYLMLGMALIAMCFNLMQEEVIHKARTCIKTCRNIFSCCRRDSQNY